MAKYKDISTSFEKNPVTKDLVVLKDEIAVMRAVKNLVMTSTFETFYDPDKGTGLRSLLFEDISDTTSTLIKDEIERVIINYEPYRVVFGDVIVVPDPENNQYDVTIIFAIDNSIEPMELNLYLERLR